MKDEDYRDAVMNVLVPEDSELQDPAYLEAEFEGLDPEEPKPSTWVRIDLSSGLTDNHSRNLNAFGLGLGEVVDWHCSACAWSKQTAQPLNLQTPAEVLSYFKQHDCRKFPKGTV